MNDSIDVKTKLVEKLAATLNEVIPERIFDDSVGSTVYQVNHGEEWVEVTEAIFRSWTGLRRVDGEEYHGPIYNFGAHGDSTIYSGTRACFCGACQETVEPKLKTN